MKVICIEDLYNKGLEYVGGKYDITIGKIYDVEIFDNSDVMSMEQGWVRLSKDDTGKSSVYPLHHFTILDEHRNNQIDLILNGSSRTT